MQQFRKNFNNIFTNFGIKINSNRKQLDYLVNFFELIFDIGKIKADLSKNKPEKVI